MRCRLRCCRAAVAVSRRCCCPAAAALQRCPAVAVQTPSLSTPHLTIYFRRQAPTSQTRPTSQQAYQTVSQLVVRHQPTQLPSDAAAVRSCPACCHYRPSTDRRPSTIHPPYRPYRPTVHHPYHRPSPSDHPSIGSTVRTAVAVAAAVAVICRICCICICRRAAVAVRICCCCCIAAAAVLHLPPLLLLRCCRHCSIYCRQVRQPSGQVVRPVVRLVLVVRLTRLTLGLSDLSSYPYPYRPCTRLTLSVLTI